MRLARRVLADAEPLAESPQETRLRARLVADGFPRPVAQHRVRDVGGHVVARLDLAWPALRLGLEYDGREAHAVGLARDRDRQWHVHRADWLLLHVTAELLADRPALRARVGAARGEQAARLGLPS